MNSFLKAAALCIAQCALFFLRRQLELRILPLQPDMPVYFPAEADTTPAEAVDAVWLSRKWGMRNKK